MGFNEIFEKSTVDRVKLSVNYRPFWVNYQLLNRIPTV
jgi:hypothetical protein